MCLCGWIQWPIISNHLSVNSVTVFVTPELHKDFDSFRELETSPHKSFLPVVALLEYWNRRRPVPSPTITKYGKSYLHLHNHEIDELCQWIYDTRETGLHPADDKMELVHTSRCKCPIMLACNCVT